MLAIVWRGIIALALLGLVVSTAAAQVATPTVVVNDQDLFQGDSVIVDLAAINVPGWLAIYNDQSSVIGIVSLAPGAHQRIVVRLRGELTARMVAILHTDAGVPGQFEFPGPDAPLLYNGMVIQSAFQVSSGVSTAQPENVAPVPTVLPPVASTTAPAILPLSGGGVVPWAGAALGLVATLAIIGLLHQRTKRVI